MLHQGFEPVLRDRSFKFKETLLGYILVWQHEEVRQFIKQSVLEVAEDAVPEMEVVILFSGI